MANMIDKLLAPGANARRTTRSCPCPCKHPLADYMSARALPLTPIPTAACTSNRGHEIQTNVIISSLLQHARIKVYFRKNAAPENSLEFRCRHSTASLHSGGVNHSPRHKLQPERHLPPFLFSRSILSLSSWPLNCPLASTHQL